MYRLKIFISVLVPLITVTLAKTGDSPGQTSNSNRHVLVSEGRKLDILVPPSNQLKPPCPSHGCTGNLTTLDKTGVRIKRQHQPQQSQDYGSHFSIENFLAPQPQPNQFAVPEPQPNVQIQTHTPQLQPQPVFRHEPPPQPSPNVPHQFQHHHPNIPHYGPFPHHPPPPQGVQIQPNINPQGGSREQQIQMRQFQPQGPQFQQQPGGPTHFHPNPETSHPLVAPPHLQSEPRHNSIEHMQQQPSIPQSSEQIPQHPPMHQEGPPPPQFLHPGPQLQQRHFEPEDQNQFNNQNQNQNNNFGPPNFHPPMQMPPQDQSYLLFNPGRSESQDGQNYQNPNDNGNDDTNSPRADYYDDEYNHEDHDHDYDSGGGFGLLKGWKWGKYTQKHGHKGKVNKALVSAIFAEIAWTIVSSYIFVFIANAVLSVVGKVLGLSDSYLETHITLGKDGKHPFGKDDIDTKGWDSKGWSSSYGSGGGNYGAQGSKPYTPSNHWYHPATALYHQPTYQYTNGGKKYALLGYDQHQAFKLAKKYSKKYAKKAGKYGLRPKPILPYIPAHNFGPAWGRQSSSESVPELSGENGRKKGEEESSDNSSLVKDSRKDGDSGNTTAVIESRMGVADSGSSETTESDKIVEEIEATTMPLPEISDLPVVVNESENKDKE